MAGKKRTHELIDIHCILCKQECNERSNTTKEQWLNLQSKAENGKALTSLELFLVVCPGIMGQ